MRVRNGGAVDVAGRAGRVEQFDAAGVSHGVTDACPAGQGRIVLEGEAVAQVDVEAIGRPGEAHAQAQVRVMRGADLEGEGVALIADADAAGDLVAGRTVGSVVHDEPARWSLAWSPEQISQRLKVDFPHDESMRISHEAIYQALFIESRGALKRELVACLRTGRALRRPRERSRNKPQGHITEDVVISERPAEAADRAVPGHWEGDLIIGTRRSAIGTLVERKSRSTLLVHLPQLEGWGEDPPVKNGPALGGYGAAAMNAALAAAITTLPNQLRKTLTWDRGKELSGHAQFTLDTGTKVFFADPHSPWQRATNENTNGLLRQYFPKGTDLSRWSAEDLEAVALALNNRPRKVLNWKTPAEVFIEQLQPGRSCQPGNP